MCCQVIYGCCMYTIKTKLCGHLTINLHPYAVLPQTFVAFAVALQFPFTETIKPVPAWQCPCAPKRAP